MKDFLNLTAFNPQMAFGVCAMLDRLGGSAKRKELRSWLAPDSLFDGGRPPEDWGLNYAFDVIEELGIVRRDEEVLSLEAGIPRDQVAFAHDLRRRILVRGKNDDDDVHELIQGLAVLMHFDGWPLSVNWDAMQRHRDSLKVDAVRNDFRWQGLERWAVYLGFAWRLRDGIVPDPTAFLVSSFGELSVVDEVIPISTFRDRVAALAPVLDGGVAFERCRPAGSDPTRLSAPFSLALLRLERRRLLSIPPFLADAPGQLVIAVNDVERRHSHVRRTGGEA